MGIFIVYCLYVNFLHFPNTFQVAFGKLTCDLKQNHMKYTLFPKSESDLNGLVRTYDPYLIAQISSKSTKSVDPIELFHPSEYYEVCSSNTQNSTLLFSFPGQYISLSHYTIAVNPEWKPNENFPKSWIVECFYQNKWISISHVTESYLNGEIKTKLFEVSRQNIFSNTFRFTHLGTSYTNQYYFFCMYKMDFFGTITNSSYIPYSAKQYCPFSYVFHLIFFFILNESL